MKSIWPSGECKPILMLKFGAEKAKELFDIEFRSGADELDEYKEGLIEIGDIGTVLFFEYKSPPIPGITIYVDRHINSMFAIGLIKERLSISIDDIYWKSVEIKNLTGDCELEIEKFNAEIFDTDKRLCDIKKVLQECKASQYIPQGKNLLAMQRLATCINDYQQSNHKKKLSENLTIIANEISKQLSI